MKILFYEFDLQGPHLVAEIRLHPAVILPDSVRPILQGRESLQEKFMACAQAIQEEGQIREDRLPGH